MGTIANAANTAVKSGFFARFLAKMSTNYLLLAIVVFFFVDLVIPDPIPFLDEFVLGVVAVLIARWQGRNEGDIVPPVPPPADEPDRRIKNVTPVK